jgi:hypothetical protein
VLPSRSHPSPPQFLHHLVVELLLILRPPSRDVRLTLRARNLRSGYEGLLVATPRSLF